MNGKLMLGFQEKNPFLSLYQGILDSRTLHVTCQKPDVWLEKMAVWEGRRPLSGLIW